MIPIESIKPGSYETLWQNPSRTVAFFSFKTKNNRVGLGLEVITPEETPHLWFFHATETRELINALRSYEVARRVAQAEKSGRRP